MTTLELASAMRRLATALEKVPVGEAIRIKPDLPEEMQIGGLLAIQLLIDMVTSANRDVYDRPTLLVMMDAVAHDPEMFQQGLYEQMKLVWADD